jgi:hypothetical protein
MKKNKKSFKNSPNHRYNFIYKYMKVFKKMTLIKKSFNTVIKFDSVKFQSIYAIDNPQFNYSINKTLKSLYNIKNKFLIICNFWMIDIKLLSFEFSYFELNY